MLTFIKEMLQYYLPELIVCHNKESDLLTALDEKSETGEPFPFILDISFHSDCKEDNRKTEQMLENAGIKKGVLYQTRNIGIKDTHLLGAPLPRFCVGENNPFGLLPIHVWGFEGIEHYLNHFRESIQVGLAEMRSI